MKTILLASATLLAAAVPAHAQLLGGGGLGGSVGGMLSGTGSIDMPMSTVTNTTRGTLDSSVRSSGEHSVDRRSGHVKASRRAQANGSGAADQALATPLGGLTGSGSANAQASGSASGEAQLIGTDAVSAAARQTAGRARGAAAGAAGAARGLAGSAAGAASGAASAGANSAFSGAAGQLALAGSAAAHSSGMASVVPGMSVIDSGGNAIGNVLQVVADARGRVEQVLVSSDRGAALLPAANFNAAGNVLVSGMSESKVEKTAHRQSKQ